MTCRCSRPVCRIPIHGPADQGRQVKRQVGGCRGQMVEFKGQCHRPGVDYQDAGAVAPGLAHGQGQHGRLVERVRTDGQDKIRLFNFMQRYRQLRFQAGTGGFYRFSSGRVCKKYRGLPCLPAAKRLDQYFSESELMITPREEEA